MSVVWSNWLGNQRARVRSLVEATTVAQVVDTFDHARRKNENVRIVGGGGSWSPLVPVDGTLLSVRGLKAVKHVDLRLNRITVECGAMLSEVVEVATRNGLSVESPAMYLGLTVGGLIGTGSHGTGRNCATLGDAVVGFELVTVDGRVIQVDEPGSQLWRAVIANLGVLGVVSAVTLQCEPLYNVHEVHERVPAAELAGVLPVALREFEFVSAFWHPGAKWAVLKVGNRTSLPAAQISGRIEPTFFEKMAAWSGPIVPRLPKGSALVNEIVSAAVIAGVGRGARIVSEPMFSHYQQVYPRVISSEFAVPIEATAEAWQYVHDRLMQYSRAGVRPVNLVVHARFGKASNALIASSSGRASCDLECLCFTDNPHRDLFQTDFDIKMRTEFEGRPHWGKDIANPWAAAATHGKAMDEFLAIREELDPAQRLLNPFLRDEVFGLGRRRRPALTSSVVAAAVGMAAE
jgi:FAD/FMN-containing dehydrogenase